MKTFLEDIANKVSNTLDFYKEHWIRYLFILLLLFLCCLALIISTNKYVPFNNIIQINNIYDNNTLIEQQLYIYGLSINIWLSFITIISILIGGFFGIFQYDKNRKQRQQEKGAEIAKLFSEKLLLKCEIVSQVIKFSNLYDFLKVDSIDFFNFKNFDINELRYIYSNDDFPTEYKQKYKEANLNNIYYYLLERRNNPHIKKYSLDEIPNYNIKQINKIFETNTASFLPHLFTELISETLNELEYVCMNISSQAAGSKFIYQSLHQSFIRTIRILAADISCLNKGKYSDKFYTNIIYVYNSWGNLYKKDLEKEEKKRKKANKILSPKIKKI